RAGSWKAYYTVQHDYDGLDAAESYGTSKFIRPRTRAVFETAANFWFWSTSALGLLGLRFFTSRRQPRRQFFLLAMVGLILPIFIFFGDVRFHLPVVPLLLVAAAATIVTICTDVSEPDAGDGDEAMPASVPAP